MHRTEQVIQVGETYDFEFVPTPGEYRLAIGPPKHPVYVETLVARHPAGSHTISGRNR